MITYIHYSLSVFTCYALSSFPEIKELGRITLTNMETVFFSIRRAAFYLDLG